LVNIIFCGIMNQYLHLYKCWFELAGKISIVLCGVEFDLIDRNKITKNLAYRQYWEGVPFLASIQSMYVSILSVRYLQNEVKIFWMM